MKLKKPAALWAAGFKFFILQLALGQNQD